MTSVCGRPKPTSGWVLILYPDPGIRLLILIDGSIWWCQTKRFVIFFGDHDRWTTLRRMISGRILYQHSIGLGVRFCPKVNWKCFVKIYIITYPARFHSNPSHEAFGKDDKTAPAPTLDYLPGNDKKICSYQLWVVGWHTWTPMSSQ